jgi:hypothetical protein
LAYDGCSTAPTGHEAYQGMISKALLRRKVIDAGNLNGGEELKKA